MSIMCISAIVISHIIKLIAQRLMPKQSIMYNTGLICDITKLRLEQNKILAETCKLPMKQRVTVQKTSLLFQ